LKKHTDCGIRRQTQHTHTLLSLTFVEVSVRCVLQT
jgi:hypothetical protein